jgi:hypothetical protein
MRIAYQTGHEWRHRPDIARAVNLWIKERLQQALPPSATTPEQQAEQIVRTAWVTARANPLWFTRISADGKSLIPDFSHATVEQLAAIESFDTVERIVGGDTLEVRTRVKLKDSGRALALLARAFGLDRQEVVLPGNVEIKVTYEDRPSLSRCLVVEGASALGPPS